MVYHWVVTARKESQFTYSCATLSQYWKIKKQRARKNARKNKQ